VVNLRVELLVREVRTKLLSQASDGAAEVTWSWRDVAAESCWRWCYRVDVGHGTMSLSGHASDDATEATVLPRQLGCGAMSMPMLT
jgi:hypothetical protein